MPERPLQALLVLQMEFHLYLMRLEEALASKQEFHYDQRG